jgi:hypothetical protein
MPCERCKEIRRKTMRVFGFTIPFFVLVLVALVLGARYAGKVRSLPLVGGLAGA